MNESTEANQNPTQIADLAKDFILTGSLGRDISRFLARHGQTGTIGHSHNVAREASRLAIEFNGDPEAAASAGWLHDISAVIPPQQRAVVAKGWSVPVLPEEEAFPLIIHQKLSIVIAREIFQIDNESILSAIGCHTTLKANPSLLDKVIFVADKIKWDQKGKPPYLDALMDALQVSLDDAAFCHLDYLWSRRHTLKVIHPWLAAAHEQFSQRRILYS